MFLLGDGHISQAFLQAGTFFVCKRSRKCMNLVVSPGSNVKGKKSCRNLICKFDLLSTPEIFMYFGSEYVAS